MADTPKSEHRIAKLLARAGVASRREVERMIAEGRVALNGVAIDTPATLLRSLHGVTVDGQAVAAAAPARLFLFHKPNGLLVTERDPAGRPTIYDRLPRDLPRVVPVGRLDLNTEGLLLLTTDGGLKRQLELPASGVERAYRARTYGDVSQAQLEELIDGVEVDGVRYGPIDANLERRTGANTWIELILTEGKNREVRRVLEHLGLQVSRLIRIRYGPFVLADLQPGEVGEVRQHDLVEFRRQLEKKQKPDHAIAVAPFVPPEVRQASRAPTPAAAAPAARAPAGERRAAPATRAPGGAPTRGGPRGPREDARSGERPARPGEGGRARAPAARSRSTQGRGAARTDRSEAADGAPHRTTRPGERPSRPPRDPSPRAPGRREEREELTTSRPRPAGPPRGAKPPRPSRPGGAGPRRPGKR